MTRRRIVLDADDMLAYAIHHAQEALKARQAGDWCGFSVAANRAIFGLREASRALSCDPAFNLNSVNWKVPDAN